MKSLFLVGAMLTFSLNTSWAHRKETSLIPKLITEQTLPMSAPLTGQIIFSNEPFIGDSPTNTKISDFKAWGEIYARVQFAAPLKQIIEGLDNVAWRNDEGILVGFKVVQTVDNQTTEGITKFITVAELEKNYVDFDIAPALNKSRDPYNIDFSDAVASWGSSYFKDRAKGEFLVSFLLLDGRHEPFPEQNFSGKFTIDYSNLPAGDEGVNQIAEWERQIYQAKNESVVEANQARFATKLTGTAPRIVFVDNTGAEATSFKAGDEIYAKLLLDKEFAEYFTISKPEYFQIDIKCLNYAISGIAVSRQIRMSELHSKVIAFDIFPSLEKAKDFYSNNLGFYFTLYGGGNSAKQKVIFEISLSAEYNVYYSSMIRLDAFGEFEMDFSQMTNEKRDQLFSLGRKAAEAAEERKDQIYAEESAEFAKSLPLPLVFTGNSGPGYSGYTKSTITSMIKQRFSITEVYMLTFDVPEGTGDFTALKDLSGYPSEKLGNHVFYFAFKDPIDNQFKFTGGRLRMLYEGDGKYSEPVIFPYSPLQNEDAAYPFDYARKNLGFESVFFLDGTKIKV